MSMRSHLFGCTCQSHVARPWRRPEHWSSADVAYLERWYGLRTDEAIARRLGRSLTGLRLKAKRLRIRKRDAGYTATSLAEVMGVDPTTVMRAWVARGGLRATRSFRQGSGLVYIISEDDIETFIRTRGWWIDWHKVPPDSPFAALVADNRWYSMPQVHRATGRLKISTELRAGRVPGQRRGTHWYMREADVARLRRLPPEHIEESVWRRAQRLRMQRERRRRREAAA